MCTRKALEVETSLPSHRHIQDPRNVHHSTIAALRQGNIFSCRLKANISGLGLERRDDDYSEDMPVQKGQQTETVVTAAPVYGEFRGSGSSSSSSDRYFHVLTPLAFLLCFIYSTVLIVNATALYAPHFISLRPHACCLRNSHVDANTPILFFPAHCAP